MIASGSKGEQGYTKNENSSIIIDKISKVKIKNRLSIDKKKRPNIFPKID